MPRTASTVRLLLALLVLLAGRARAQFVISGVEPGSPCVQEEGFGGMVDAVNDITGKDFSRGSLRDSKGRCTMYRHQRPFQDELYARPPSYEDLAEVVNGLTPHGYTLDMPSRGWGQWDIEDHLGLRMGYFALHGPSLTYVYFNRYGAVTYVAGLVRDAEGNATDQWVLYRADGTRAGVLYAADPGRPWRWDERMVAHYPFVYEYPYAH